MSIIKRVREMINSINRHEENKIVVIKDLKDFKVPAGRYTKSFISSNGYDFINSVNEIQKLAVRGDRSGIDEIELFIRINRSSKDDCQFYSSARRVLTPDEIGTYPQIIFGHALTRGLFENPALIQDMIYVIEKHSRKLLIQMGANLGSKIGEGAFRSFEILRSHIFLILQYEHLFEEWDLP